MIFKNIKPEIVERLKQKLAANTFSTFIGVDYLAIDQGEVTAKVLLAKNLLQQNGYGHGGLISTMCDVVSGFAAYTVIDLEKQVVTGEIKISYLRAAKGKALYANGKVIKAGNRIVFTEAEAYYFEENERKIVAKSSASMVVVGNKY